MDDQTTLAALLLAGDPHDIDTTMDWGDVWGLKTARDLAARLIAAGVTAPTPSDPAAPLREALDGLPRLWWCSGWGTLNEKRHHGNADACAGESCGNVAYVRDVDLRAALADPKEADRE